MINKTPFNIGFPLKIFDKSKRVNFIDDESRKEIFNRSIYSFLYTGRKNSLLEKRNQIYHELSQKAISLVQERYSSLEVMNVSVFGSSLFSKNPRDFDFLVITNGNKFLLEETTFNLEDLLLVRERKSKKYKVGISIKGVDNFVNGICNPFSSVPEEYQKQIIYRTASALFRRHIPMFGYDFVENREAFQKNLYAQVSDLLVNTFDLYYLNNEKIKLNNSQRSKKILSRVYEAVTYLTLTEKSSEIENLRREVYLSMNTNPSLEKTEKLFNSVVSIYNNKTDKKTKNE